MLKVLMCQQKNRSWKLKGLFVDTGQKNLSKDGILIRRSSCSEWRIGGLDFIFPCRISKTSAKQILVELAQTPGPLILLGSKPNAKGGAANLTDQATLKDLSKAMLKPENKSVTLHKPGSHITVAGTEYVVQPDVSWRKAAGK